MMNEALDEGTRRVCANADLRNAIAATTEAHARTHARKSQCVSV